MRAAQGHDLLVVESLPTATTHTHTHVKTHKHTHIQIFTDTEKYTGVNVAVDSFIMGFFVLHNLPILDSWHFIVCVQRMYFHNMVLRRRRK